MMIGAFIIRIMMTGGGDDHVKMIFVRIYNYTLYNICNIS